MDEERLAREIAAYKELAKTDKKIDVASLMISALQKQQGNLLPPKQKKWAYLVSLVVPPFGLLFALKFYFSEKDDGKDTAWICIVLTAFSILLAIVSMKLILSGAGTSLDQIQKIKPQDIQDLVQ